MPWPANCKIQQITWYTKNIWYMFPPNRFSELSSIFWLGPKVHLHSGNYLFPYRFHTDPIPIPIPIPGIYQKFITNIPYPSHSYSVNLFRFHTDSDTDNDNVPIPCFITRSSRANFWEFLSLFRVSYPFHTHSHTQQFLRYGPGIGNQI